MTERLSENQLSRLAEALHEGARESSQALAAWLQSQSLVEVDSVEQLPLDEALGIIRQTGDVCCFTSLAIDGWLQGQLLLGFDDASGLSLTDLILGRPPGTAAEWGEIEISSALETMNIIGSVYLNALARHYTSQAGTPVELLPTPPDFHREFAESLLESAFLGQAIWSDWVVAAKTRFTIQQQRLDWTLLFIPDGESMRRLASLTQ